MPVAHQCKHNELPQTRKPSKQINDKQQPHYVLTKRKMDFSNNRRGLGASTDDEDNQGEENDYTDSIFHAATATSRFGHDSDDDSDDDGDGGGGTAIDEHDDDIDIGFRDTSRYRNNNKKTRSRRERQDDATYGVFYERPNYDNYDDDSDGNDDGGMPGLGLGSSRRRRGAGSDDAPPGIGAAPMFVAASSSATSNAPKSESDQGQVRNGSTVDDTTASMFVKASSSTSETTRESTSQSNHQKDENSHQSSKTVKDDGNEKDPMNVENEEDDDDEEEETKKMQEEQRAADDYFMKLLEKAKETKKTKKKPKPFGLVSSQSQDDGLGGISDGGGGIGLGSGIAGGGGGGGGLGSLPVNMPTSFGGQQFQPQQQKYGEQTGFSGQKKKTDPSLAKWEKHTKGIGSKLLSKMGWSGSGGLGSNRRSHQPSESSTQHQQQTSEADVSTRHSSSTVTAKPKKGISRPVEVVVRPANMGLGFGSFKEASQLKSNRQIEAEVRGIELEDEKEKKRKRRRFPGSTEDDVDGHEDEYGLETGGIHGSSAMSSAIPSTDALLSQQTWKRRKAGGKSRKKKNAVEVISYEEMLKRQQERTGGVGSTQPVIIDMRGPNAQKTPSETLAEVPLGEELLYNLSFLLNTYENKLYSASTFKTSTEKKMERIQSTVAELEDQKRLGAARITKLQTALKTVEEIKEIAASSTPRSATSAQKQVEEAVSTLASTFTSAERQELQFWNILAPSLLSPIMQSSVDRWDPFDDSLEGVKKGHEIIDSFFLWSLSDNHTGDRLAEEDQRDTKKLRYSMIFNLLIPKLKSSFESSRWDPIMHSAAAIDVYEYLNHRAVEFDLSTKPKRMKMQRRNLVDSETVFESEEDDIETANDSSSLLANHIKTELIIDVVYPKLQTAISRWKPSYDSSTHSIGNRLDLWVLPWVPHLDHPGILPNLMADCRRKLKGAISYLNRKIGGRTRQDDLMYVTACYDMLLPWNRVFDDKSLQRLVGGTTSGSSEILSRLARLLSSQFRVEDECERNWKGLEILVGLHAHKFLTDVDFMSILEAEVVTNLAIMMYECLLQQQSSSVALQHVAKTYSQWKKRIFWSALIESSEDQRDKQVALVGGDAMVCRIFYSILRMIQLCCDENTSTEKLEILEPNRLSYITVAARRSKETRRNIEEDYVRMEGAKSVGATEARLRLLRRRRGVEPISFREVVEETAQTKGIMFQPKTGPNALQGGRQVFIFGGISIYLEGDVVFYSKDSTWHPISLDHLLQMTGH